jgi:hypothetical protein
MLECRRIGSPPLLPPGVPPGEDAQDGAIRIFGAINVLSDKRLFGKVEWITFKKLLPSETGEPPNHQEPVGQRTELRFRIDVLFTITYRVFSSEEGLIEEN